MLSIVKDKKELKKLKAACKLAAETLKYIGSILRPGLRTGDLDMLAYKFITDRGAYPAPLRYDPTKQNPFPKSICTSINEVACHGIPDDTELKEGDIVNIDVTVIYMGYHGDTSAMFSVGTIDVDKRLLIEVAKLARDETIKAIKPGVDTNYLGFITETVAKQAKLDVIDNFYGHGVGKQFHMDPLIPSKPITTRGTVLKPGMVFTVEPILTNGYPSVRILNDGWTAVTEDKSLSAQWEHTVIVTEDGVEILTEV